MSCHFQLHLQSKNILCIQEDLSLVSFHDFWMDVWQQSIIIKNVQADEWALWENDSYEFLVLFFSGLFAD
mgnify:FL=1